MEFVHKPVLFAETIAALDVRPGRTYIDGTVGGGGHALAILQGLGGQGRLLAIDQDPDAIAAAGERLKDFSNLSLARGNFSWPRPRALGRRTASCWTLGSLPTSWTTGPGGSPITRTRPWTCA